MPLPPIWERDQSAAMLMSVSASSNNNTKPGMQDLASSSPADLAASYRN